MAAKGSPFRCSAGTIASKVARLAWGLQLLSYNESAIVHIMSDMRITTVLGNILTVAWDAAFHQNLAGLSTHEADGEILKSSMYSIWFDT
mmetsp:Transcript_37992/g.88767  ORF Transcript_37992/g.88767 Transcript_37992/m.88767 type:complete len:90 (+) Transcript_37992:1998-2267(+)